MPFVCNVLNRLHNSSLSKPRPVITIAMFCARLSSRIFTCSDANAFLLATGAAISAADFCLNKRSSTATWSAAEEAMPSIVVSVDSATVSSRTLISAQTVFSRLLSARGFQWNFLPNGKGLEEPDAPLALPLPLAGIFPGPFPPPALGGPSPSPPPFPLGCAGPLPLPLSAFAASADGGVAVSESPGCGTTQLASCSVEAKTGPCASSSINGCTGSCGFRAAAMGSPASAAPGTARSSSPQALCGWRGDCCGDAWGVVRIAKDEPPSTFARRATENECLLRCRGIDRMAGRGRSSIPCFPATFRVASWTVMTPVTSWTLSDVLLRTIAAVPTAACNSWEGADVDAADEDCHRDDVSLAVSPDVEPEPCCSRGSIKLVHLYCDFSDIGKCLQAWSKALNGLFWQICNETEASADSKPPSTSSCRRAASTCMVWNKLNCSRDAHGQATGIGGGAGRIENNEGAALASLRTTWTDKSAGMCGAASRSISKSDFSNVTKNVCSGLIIEVWKK
mmetsp:Transcript_113810/g.321882  ORF Transcript_113810/g.321882 Transcript_113810/m.321882 type:complete len:508 (+) Transcript_113810:1405-2928(+)